MTIRVLLADDHGVVRAGIRKFLEAAGDIEVVAEAEDGPAAVRAIEDQNPDVAVLDIQMPGQSGIEVARWARAHRPHVGLLILSAYDDPASHRFTAPPAPAPGSPPAATGPSSAGTERRPG